MSDPNQHLIGRTITAVRSLSPAELRAEMWDRSPIVLVLDDGTILLPSRDEEGNGPGALFSITPAGKSYIHVVTPHAWRASQCASSLIQPPSTSRGSE